MSEDGRASPKFYLDMRFDRTKFIREFEAQFPFAEADPLAIEEAMPLHFPFLLHVGQEMKEKLQKFLDDYAERHNAGNKWSPATTHHFNPAC